MKTGSCAVAILAAFVIEGPAAIAASEPLHLTLDQALARATAQAEEVRIANTGPDQAKGRVREALSGALPQITGGLTFNQRLDSVYESLASDTSLGGALGNTPFAATRDWRVELEASQLLFDGGKVLAAMRGARSYQEAAQAHADEATATLLFQVKSAYYDALAAEEVVAIAESGLQQATDHKNQVALYYEQGSRAEYDLLRAQVDASNQEPALVTARTGLLLATLRLKRLINTPDDQELVLDTALESEDGTIPVPVSDSDSEIRRGALVEAQATVAFQEQVVRAARAEAWPTLRLSTILAHQAFPGDEWPRQDQFVRDWQASLRLSFPIFTGFRVAGLTDQARAALERARAERDQVSEQVRLDLADARAQMQRSWAMLYARRETVRWATRAHSLSDIRYSNGLSTQLEVSDARLAMQTAQVNQVRATRDYLVALADLERALGRSVPVERRSIEQISASTFGGGIER